MQRSPLTARCRSAGSVDDSQQVLNAVTQLFVVVRQKNPGHSNELVPLQQDDGHKRQPMRSLEQTTTSYGHDFQAKGQPEVTVQGPTCSTADLAHGTLRFSGHLPGEFDPRATHDFLSQVRTKPRTVQLKLPRMFRVWWGCARC